MLTSPVVRALASDGSLTPAMASHIMVAILQGLQLHGQHDANQGSLITLGAQVYECLRPKFPNIVEVMQQIPGINPADLQRFDEKMSVVSSKGNKVEKGKKDLFKKITNQVSDIYLRRLISTVKTRLQEHWSTRTVFEILF